MLTTDMISIGAVIVAYLIKRGVRHIHSCNVERSPGGHGLAIHLKRALRRTRHPLLICFLPFKGTAAAATQRSMPAK